MMQILGLDTSNYTTSAALLDLEHGTVQQAKQLLPVKAGEAGLRQSDAVFHHTRQLPDSWHRRWQRRNFAPSVCLPVPEIWKAPICRAFSQDLERLVESLR